MKYLNRFDNTELGEEYSLFALSVPHHQEFQNIISTTLQSFCQNIQNQEIKVLEIGTGNGITTARILDSNPQIKVTSIDNSKVMLEQARQVFADVPDRVEFIEKDALTALKELRNSSFDCFASAYTLHNFPEKYRNQVFTEIGRVLKPDSMFINADKIAIDDPKDHEKYLTDQLERFKIYSNQTVNRPEIQNAWTQHYYEDELNKLTESDHLKNLRKLGFEALTIYRNEMEAVIAAYKF